jgi:iron complex outermembrane receptor protein
VFNAQALNRGGELSFHVLPTSGLDVSLGIAYENPIVKNVPLQYGVGPYVDQRPPQSPKLTENLDISQTWLLPNEGTLTLQGVVNHVGQRWFNTINDPVLQDGPYTIENARLTYGSPSSDWELGLWVNNLSNSQYVLTAFDMSTTEGTVNRVYAPPRQFGATITYKFR